MMRSIKFITTSLLALGLLWLASSWLLAKQSSQAVDDFLSNWASSSGQYIAEFESLEEDAAFFSAERTIHASANVPYLHEQFGDVTIHVQQTSGPLLFGEKGMRLGRAEWLVTLLPEEGGVLSEQLPNTFTLFNDFSNQLHISGTAKELSASSWNMSNLALQGVLDVDERFFQFAMNMDAFSVNTREGRLTIPESRLSVDMTPDQENAGKGELIKVELNADNGQLFNAKNEANIPVNLSSTASIWKNNGTLDADFKVSLVNTLPLNGDEAILNVQLREWLASGFVEYLAKASDSVDALKQAEWVLEEVETQEQQDFYNALRYQSEAIARLQWAEIVEPMLAAGKSQVAINLGVEDLANPLNKQRSQLTLSGTASSSKTKPSLPLAGEMRLASSQFDENIVRLLQRWAARGSLREYETAFESDLTIQGQSLSLNNRDVSLVRLMDELKRTLIDQ